MLNIIPIRALYDNYIWLIMHPQTRHCAVVDPGDAAPVLAFLQEKQLNLTAILATHHHADHVGGVNTILQSCAVPVFGPATESISGVTHPVSEGERVRLDALNVDFQVFDIPGHTAGHIAFYGDGALFCGDTLFSGGCGRLFEGTAAQMFHSLAKLVALPPETRVYCAHEYTADNLQFARQVEPKNVALLARIVAVDAMRSKNNPTLPSTLQLECATNPFLRSHIDGVRQAAEVYAGKALPDPVAVFATLRAWKDRWRS